MSTTEETKSFFDLDLGFLKFKNQNGGFHEVPAENIRCCHQTESGFIKLFTNDGQIFQWFGKLNRSIGSLINELKESLVSKVRSKLHIRVLNNCNSKNGKFVEFHCDGINRISIFLNNHYVEQFSFLIQNVVVNQIIQNQSMLISDQSGHHQMLIQINKSNCTHLFELHLVSHPYFPSGSDCPQGGFFIHNDCLLISHEKFLLLLQLLTQK